MGYGQDRVSILSTMQKSMVDLHIIIKWVSAWLEHKIVVETTNGIHAPTSHWRTQTQQLSIAVPRKP